jgi:DNA-binding CsgD family transcriptional regulator
MARTDSAGEAAVLRIEDYVKRSQQAKTIPDLVVLYAQAIATAGYENCVLSSVRGRQVGHVAWFEIPDGSTGAYVERRWESVGSVLARSRRMCRPFLWSEADEVPDVATRKRHAGDWVNGGPHAGIAFPFHGPSHRLDLISISRCTAVPSDVESPDLLYAISFHAWTRYLDMSNDPLVRGGPVGEPLTPRELEILRWCKDGKTRPEIGEILSISHKTVEFHLSNVMTKLGATNQTAAVVVALQRGLIEL